MRHSFRALPLLVGLLASTSGCTLIGAAVGAAVDRHAQKTVKPIDAEDVESLQVGARIELELKDGRTLCGRYRGLDRSSSAAGVRLRLEQGGGTSDVELGKVVAIGRVTTPNRGKVTGLLIGLLIDAILIPRTVPPFCESCVSSY
jgi:hypothetical protein